MGPSGETVFLVIAVPAACATVVAVMVIKGLFGLGRPKREFVAALNSLRDEVQALRATVQRLEKRMETVEEVIAGSEPQARARIAAAAPPVTMPTVEPQPQTVRNR